MTRDTPKRLAAVSARARTQQTSCHPLSLPTSSSTSSASAKSSSESESLAAKSTSSESLPPPTAPSRSGVPPVNAMARRRGRPSKDSPRPSSRPQYKRICDFTPLPAGVRDISFWMECMAGARQVKRGLRHSKETTSSTLLRPPVDILAVRLPEMEELAPIHLPRMPSIRKNDHLLLTSGKSSPSKPSKGAPSKSTLSMTVEGKAFKVDEGEAHFQSAHGLFTINAGVGGVAAMDWAPHDLQLEFQLLAISCYPSYGHLDQWVVSREDKDIAHCPIQIWSVSTVRNVAKRMALVEHRFGLVRSLAWCPFFVQGERVKRPSYAMLGIFSDGYARVWSLEGDTDEGTIFHLEEANGDGKVFKLEGAVAIGDEEFVVTAAAWCPVQAHANLVAIGTNDGRVLLWRIGGEAGATCVAGVRPSGRPVTSLSFDDGDAFILSVGLHDSPAILIDWREAHLPVVLQSTLANIPLVRWSRMHAAWLLADSEMSVRALPSAGLVEKVSFPAGTFPCSILDLAVSPWHNVIALAGADGTVHLSFLDDPRRHLIVEQQVLAIQTRSANVEIKLGVSIPRSTKGAVQLYGIECSISVISWSRSITSPGLLAMASGATGVVVLFSVDHLVLLEPGD